MARFLATTSAGTDRVVVTLVGECDLSRRDELTSVLLNAVDRAAVVHVDVAGLTFIDSSGIHGLVTAHHAARRAGGRLYVLNATGTVATLFELTGIGELLSPSASAAPERRDGHRD